MTINKNRMFYAYKLHFSALIFCKITLRGVKTARAILKLVSKKISNPIYIFPTKN